jgi:hypothetical protein
MTISIGPFETNRSAASYPVGSGTTLIFGADYGHSGFVTPMARFQFFDPLGTTARGPIVFIRMGGSFQSALSNGFQETQSIFGQPSSDGTVSGALGAAAKGGLDALYKQVAGAAGSAAGFLGSAGLSGKAQYEFMTRRVLNTFQQLVYQGPTFRRFTLPFTMKPTSMQEAEKMIQIIKSFRIAASPKGAGDNITLKVKGADDTVTNRAPETAAPDPNAPPDPNAGTFTQTEINDLFSNGNTGAVALDAGARTSVSNFSFGYPDMCRFEIVLQKGAFGGGTTDTFLTQVFSSEYCVIENVQVDYGGQNKMVFFSPEGATGGKYYPSEVTLSLSLKETALPTDGAVFTDHSNASRTIF